MVEVSCLLLQAIACLLPVPWQHEAEHVEHTAGAAHLHARRAALLVWWSVLQVQGNHHEAPKGLMWGLMLPAELTAHADQDGTPCCRWFSH